MDDDASCLEEAAARISTALNNNLVEEIKADKFGVFIYYCNRGIDMPHEMLKEVSSNILTMVGSGRLLKESQVVAATAHCTVEAYLRQEDFEALLDYFLNLLENESYENYKLYLCNGISTYLSRKLFKTPYKLTPEKPPVGIDTLFKKILKIVESECNKLNANTFLAFDSLVKTLFSINDIYRPMDREVDIVSEECFKSLLHIVLANLENPMPGVRQENAMLLDILMFNIDYWWESVLPELTSIYNVKRNGLWMKHRPFLELVLTHLPWTMKSKYFLLKPITETPLKLELCYREELVEGLLFSLSTPHLVSAGADLYQGHLFPSDLPEWINWYFVPISRIMSDPGPSLVLENFFNYWFQRDRGIRPEIVDYLLKEVSSMNLYSYISLLRISRKEGLSSFDWETIDKQRLKVALEDYSDKIRSQAFSLVCTSMKTSVLPVKEEFEAVEQFLKQNINSDNAALRQSLLSSFTDFSIRIRDSISIMQKDNQPEQEVSHCFSFLDWLHSFLIFNLENKCNYQRKITSLELYKIVLSYFGEPVGKMFYTRKNNMEYLRLKSIADRFSYIYVFESKIYQKVLFDCLLDEDSNVRGSSAKILLKYFKNSGFLKVGGFESLYQTALSLCSSQIFYTAESGALIIKIILVLARCNQSSAETLKNMVLKKSFMAELLSSAEDQFRNLQKDLLKAASQGSFLYGTLQAIRLIGTGKGPETLTSIYRSRLLLLMEGVVKYFISVLSSKSDLDLDSAPSFGEMGQAISAVVDKSSAKESQEKQDEEGNVLAVVSSSDSHLTPAQQLVLNCVWLNLKECTVLCFKLVKMNILANYNCTETCLVLVISILQKCRHKGAIEAAGFALSKIIAHITKVIDAYIPVQIDHRLLILPEKVMKNFLETIVDKTSTTVSRRSAGLAIMVHKLIAADVRQSKPLLPHCVNSLLALAKKKPSEHDSATLADLPQTQAMHFLGSLVQDAGLKQHLLPYYTDICTVVLDNLASPLWTIRNAALQLFGAFVPKLVGQRMQQEEGKGSQYLLFEGLYTHAKPVVHILLNDLADAANSNSTMIHAKLMPILTLVTHMNVGLLRVLTADLAQVVVEFQECFQQLFKSSIVNVRELSAKAHTLFLCTVELIPTIFKRVDEIISFLAGKESVIHSENELHGYLLSVTYLVKRYDEEKLGMKLLKLEEEKVNEIVSCLSKEILSGQQSYFIKSLVFEWKRPTLLDFDITTVYKNIAEIPVGISHFVDKQMSWEIASLKEKELEDTVEFCLLKCPMYDVQLSCLNALKARFKSKHVQNSGKCDSFYTLFTILKEFALECNYNELTSLSIELMFYTLENMNTNPPEIATTLFCQRFISYSLEHFSSNQSSSLTLTFLLPVVCGMLSSQKSCDYDLVLNVASLIKARCDTDFDQDIRIHAAKAMVLLIPVLKSEMIKTTLIGEFIWEACVVCLQDEVSEVRYEASRFVSSFFEDLSNVMNSFLSLVCLFKLTSVTKLMVPEKALECLWRMMLSVSAERSSDNGITNPFDHGVKSIFAEEGVISNMAYHSLLEVAESPENNFKSTFKELFSDFTKGDISPPLSNYLKDIDKCINSESDSGK